MFHLPASPIQTLSFIFRKLYTENLWNYFKLSRWMGYCTTSITQHQNLSGEKKKKRTRHKQIPTPTNKHRALRLACHSRRTVPCFALICRLNLLVSGSARSKSICICRATNLHTVSRAQQPIMSGCGVDTGEHAWIMFKWEHVCGIRSGRQHVSAGQSIQFQPFTWITVCKGLFFPLRWPIKCYHVSSLYVWPKSIF